MDNDVKIEKIIKQRQCKICFIKQKEMGYKYEIWIYSDRKINKKKIKLNDLDKLDTKEEKNGKMHKIIIL